MVGRPQGPDGKSAEAVVFATTHWSTVLQAGRRDTPEALEALGRLCQTYWYPIYAYVRRHGRSPDDAQDLTQEFLFHLLKRGDLAAVQPERGRFRGYLLAAVKHFLANEWRKLQTQKRGGGNRFVPIDSLVAEHRYHIEDTRELPPDKVYDRSWALTLLEETRERLRREFASDGKAERFELLEQFLPGEGSDLTYAEAGRKLGLSEAAVKSEAHRLSKRYRALLRTGVAHTVTSPEEIDDEIRYLAALLAG
jgi:RNA polymerase sigma-70 factor (ECF subfamily)